MSCMNMSNDSKTSATMDPNATINDITNDMSKVAVSDNSICGTCTDTSSEQNLEEHIKSGDISINNGGSSTGIDILCACAACGKEGASNLCNKCKSVMYCNAACKKRHRSKHKKQCERRVAELRDIELFKPHPPEEDCPICFQRLPFLGTGRRYKSCCGKMICSGCIHAVQIRDKEALCPFCRTPTPARDGETIDLLIKRVDVGDAEAIFNLGSYYSRGICGLPQDFNKALELNHQAAELGHVGACYNIGRAYQEGRGVEIDIKKAVYYWELAAMGGCAPSRLALGYIEQNNRGNMVKAIKHYMISVEGGVHKSLKQIQELYSNGHVSKEKYTEALRSYQKYLDEIRSPQRDKAAAYKDEYKYIE